jgi:hypothetical protein
MTGKGKKKSVDFIVRPKPAKENLPPTLEQWVEEGKAADARPEKEKEKEKRLTLNLPPDLHTAFKGRCVFEGITIQDKVRLLIERDLADARRAAEDKASPA